MRNGIIVICISLMSEIENIFKGHFNIFMDSMYFVHFSIGFLVCFSQVFENYSCFRDFALIYQA